MKYFFYFALVLCLGAFQACGGDSDDVVNPNSGEPDIPVLPDLPAYDPNDVVEIKDPAFRAYLIDHYDRNNDSQLSYAEADLILNLELSRYDQPVSMIRSLEGISNLRNLKELTIAFDIDEVDLHDCRSLTSLDCYDARVLKINFSRCISLTSLYSKENSWGESLASLNFSDCVALKELKCPMNRLTNLNLSGCSQLKILNCRENQLTNLNLSGCSQLMGLRCSYNQLQSLDLSCCSQLTELDCRNNKLTSLDISKNTKMNRLNIQMNGLLENLYVWKGFSWENLYDSYKDDNTQIIENSKIIIFP